MRKLLLLSFYLVYSSLIKATNQVPDYLYYQNIKLAVDIGWSYPSPLEKYFLQNNIDYPFAILSTANYRGHIATWEIRNNKLYLKEISVNGRVYKPVDFNIKSKMDSVSIDGMVNADWFSGIISCQSSDLYIFHIREGQIVHSAIITKRDFRKINKFSDKDTSNYDLINKYLLLVINQNYVSYYFRLEKDDTITMGDKGGYFDSNSNLSPLLLYYSNDHMRWPYNWENFEKNGAPNCKWIIEDNRLFLAEINLYSGSSFFTIDKDTVNLETIFRDKVNNKRVFGDWVSGIYVIKQGEEAEYGVFPAYKEFTATALTYLRIEKGIIIEKYTIPNDFDYKNIPKDTDPGLIKIIDEFN